MCIINYSISACLDEGIENCLTHITGTITSLTDEDDEIEAGRIDAYYLDIGLAIDNGYDLIEIFDMDLDFNDFYHVLYDDAKMFFRDKIIKKYDDSIFSSNLLLLEKLEILPGFRGRQIGLAAVYITIQKFVHGCGLVAMKPYPLQFDQDKDMADEWSEIMKYSTFSKNKNIAQEKLRSYYKKLGFSQVENSDIFTLNPVFKNPTLEDIGYLNNDEQ